jgi:Carboxypeptidase regulatory-like domain
VLRILALIALLFTSLVSDATAAPVVTVKAKTVLEVEGVFPAPDGGVRLKGRLKDKDLGVGIPRQTVRINLTIDGQRQRFTARTDEHGHFTLDLPGVEQQRFNVAMEFSGAKTYAAARPPAQDLDISKKTPVLRISAPAELESTARRIPIELRTTVEGQPTSLQLQLKAGRGTTAVRTDGVGKAKIEVSTESLGGPGIVTIRARFLGDTRLNPAAAQVDTLVVSKVELSLQATGRSVRADDDLVLGGQIVAASGGIQGATINLEVMGRHEKSALSNAEGRFSFRLTAKDYPPGELDLIARFSPDVIWRREASSNAVKIMILPPKPIPVRLYVIPAVITAVIMLALVMIRFGPAIKVRLATEPDDPSTSDTKPTEEVVASGARFSRTGLRGLIKQASDIHGVIWDPVDKHPIVGATIRIQGPGDSLLELQSNGGGRFEVPGLSPGVHKVGVKMHGYVSERFTIQIPHRGNLHGLRVDLVQVRVRVLEIYRAVALPLLPDRDVWGCWSPRRLCRHVGSVAGQRQWYLERLTDLLEEVYWSPVLPDEQMVDHARELRSSL